jgi:uncharacterized membrane protein
MASALVLSTLGVAPRGGPVHDVAISLLVSVAIPLLLFKADLRSVVRRSGRLFWSFLVATVATVLATLTAYLLLRPGAGEAPAFAATNAAGLLGGSVNFVAVAEATNLSATGFAAAATAFVVFNAPYFLTAIALGNSRALAARFGRRAPSSAGSAELAVNAPDSTAATEAPPPLGLFTCFALAVIVAALGKAIGDALGLSQYGLLLVTVLALAAANAAPGFFARVHGETQLGLYMLLLYFALVGFSASLQALLGVAAVLAVFVGLTIALHLLFLLAIGWLVRLPLVELLAASSATVGGPGSAAVFVQSINQSALMTPVVLTGLLGYATATFTSLALARVLQLIP